VETLPSRNNLTKARARHRDGVVLVLLATIAWSASGLFTRLLSFDLWTIVAWRGTFGALFIGAYVLWRYGRDTFHVIGRMGRMGIFITLCSTSTITLFVPAFQFTSVANAFTIYAALPFAAAGISWLWLRERPTAGTLVASAIALAGIVVMLGPSADGPRLGDGLAMLATITTALLTVAIRKSRNVDMVPVALLANVLSVLVAAPLAAHLFDLTPRDYLVAAGSGLIPMTLGLMLYVIGSALIPSTLTTLINMMETPFGVIWAWVGIGEVPTTTTFIGGGIVLASVLGQLVLDGWRTSSRRPAGHADGGIPSDAAAPSGAPEQG
jgi:drug/metabolite transporter (DMT)-like permease